jgi:hypothetical protein
MRYLDLFPLIFVSLFPLLKEVVSFFWRGVERVDLNRDKK